MATQPPNPGSNTSSGTKTYADTSATAKTTVVSNAFTRSEHIATYFADDLEEFVRITHTDLATELQVPPEYSQDTHDIITMLYDDLAHMLRDELITGIHILLSDITIDPNSSAYPVRYHVQYTIDLTPSASSTPTQPLLEGGKINPPRDASGSTAFALLIDWNKAAGNKRYAVRRPDYNFDWVPKTSVLDATTILRFREGALTTDGARVTRWEKH